MPEDSARPRRRRLRWLALVVVVALAGMTARWFSRDAASPGARVVVVEMQVSAGRQARLFWAEDLAFTEAQVTAALLAPEAGVPQRLRFAIPARGVRWLRLDPTDAAGDIFIQRVQILDAHGTVGTLPVESIRPGHHVARLVPEAGGLRVAMAPDATNPTLLLSMGCQEPRSIRTVATTITAGWLALLSVAALSLIGVGVWAIARTALTIADRPGRRLWFEGLWIASLVVVVFAGKLLLMRAIPVTTPFWDQWDGEAAVLFVPFSNCSLSWHDMLGFHNEHRVFFTRLLALDLLALDGQWDPRLEQVVNAALHTLTAGLLAAMFWLAAGRRRLDIAVALTAVTFALPFSWENSLFGFQSAFYFLLLFSVLSLWLTTQQPTGSVSWLAGWICAACALFTAASGLLAPVAIGAAWALCAAADRSKLRDAAINIALALGIFLVGYAFSSPPLPHHEVYRVKSVTEFAIALGRSLAWPRIDRPTLAVIAWLPLALLCVSAVWRRFQTTALERLTIALALGVGLHAVALAYGRGAGGAMPAGRYMDFLSLGFMANAMALAALFDRLPARSALRRVGIAAIGIWLVIAVSGLNHLVQGSMTDLRARRPLHQAHTDNVRRFALTGDADTLRTKAPLYELPYPDPERIVNLLQEPYIRRVLPAAVRAPLQAHPSTPTGNPFVPDGLFGAVPRDPLRPAWGSFSSDGNTAVGRFESEPIDGCRLGGALQFDVAGHLGFDDHRLAVRAVRTGRETPVVRWGPVRNGWSTATVPCPDEAFTIVAADNSRWSWFAFRPPVEIGAASIAAERLIDAGWPMLLTGLILLGLAARWT